MTAPPAARPKRYQARVAVEDVEGSRQIYMNKGSENASSIGKIA